MEIVTILDKLGFLGENSENCNKRLDVLFINNPDGTVRWFWPSHVSRPLFLKFYSANGWKSKLFYTLCVVIFKLRLQQLIFHKRTFLGRTSPNFTPETEWAAFTGTPGPNRKAIVYRLNGGSGSFTKIATGNNAVKLLQNELTTLAWLRSASRLTFAFPTIVNHDDVSIEISEIARTGRRETIFSSCHQQSLLELRNETLIPSNLSALHCWNEAMNTLARLKKNNDARIPKGMLRKLDELISTLNTNKYIDVCFSHGDFTPWNMYIQDDGGLAIYDWELSHAEMPFGYDAFHFIIQHAILVQRKSWTQIQEALTNSLYQPGSLLGDLSEAKRQLYLKLYLILNTIHYVSIYSAQEKWHVQVEWLLTTWNEALSAMLAPSKSHRELLIMDVIDFLTNKSYALLKYHNTAPEKLDDLSDMDFVIEGNSYSSLGNFIKHHPLVRYRKVRKKSFMASEHIVMLDGSMASFDFIWQIKRRHLEIMDSKVLLKTHEISSHGVKIASAVQNARFVALFYSLNKSAVPTRYMHYQESLRHFGSRFDYVLERCFEEGHSERDNVIRHLRLRSSNRGIRNYLNICRYVLDCIKDIFISTGMIITFSGVDGAGKSTVIENLKVRIEKQLRKRVVVLRHRPSLLPILSAWTKGKIAAEQAAAARLPRQGNNKNDISSFLRFAYYYIDYMIGQLYVMIRYVFRGYIVLYDRYYFDFINDSQRSNIVLPPWITRLGYVFIIKPNLNFFLYAAPELILSRKKELDRTTIVELTEKYLALFTRLNKRKAQRYIPIENTELGLTLQKIMGRITA